MQQSVDDYPEISELMSGWFHQDYDIEGDSVEEIIGSFNASCSSKQKGRLIEEISQFLKMEDNVLESEFIRIFNPDIEPTGFAPTTRKFLENIVELLSQE
ncbi:contact-dependent growth inhibition system immunity protein [Methylobacter sp. BBA5.1]|jgi:CdiI immunity protein|uniref:contact-dependent growth inhibition system immunity protein n=1 Tax=Methylobacter sp. BBA5.1 TaxID=1495064 RepID=UPI000561BCFC|nr:contact-dependent growth inhibition system immunity protein [Methylobacter sp. BBA5.1]